MTGFLESIDWQPHGAAKISVSVGSRANVLQWRLVMQRVLIDSISFDASLNPWVRSEVSWVEEMPSIEGYM